MSHYWPADLITASGPAVDRAVVAGESSELWFDLVPRRTFDDAKLRLDLADTTFTMSLLRHGDVGSSPTSAAPMRVEFRFEPTPPNAERPHGSIRVKLVGLRQAGRYWLDVRASGHTPVHGSPFGLSAVAGPAAKLRLRHAM